MERGRVTGRNLLTAYQLGIINYNDYKTACERNGLFNLIGFHQESLGPRDPSSVPHQDPRLSNVSLDAS